MNDKLYEYLVKHNSLVNAVFCRFSEILPTELELSGLNFTILSQNLYDHDMSKLDVCEADGFDNYYFSEEKDTNLYREAYCHHCNKNQHHWEYWVTWSYGYPICIEMPFTATIEMLCDWTANLLAVPLFYNSMTNWYETHSEEILLHGHTKKLVYEYIEFFDQIFLEFKEKGID